MSCDQPLLGNVNVLCGSVTHGRVLSWTWSALPVTHARRASCSSDRPSRRAWARVPSPPAPAALRARDPLADAHRTRHFSNLLHVVKQAFSAASPCVWMYIYSEGQPDQGLPLSHAPAHRWNQLESWSSWRSPLALPRSAPPGCRQVPEVKAPARFCTSLTSAAPTPFLPPTHALSLSSGYGLVPVLFGKSAAVRTLPSTASLSGFLLASPCSLCFPIRMWLDQPALSFL